MPKKADIPEPLRPYNVVLVTGRRDFTDRKVIFRALNKFHEEVGINALVVSDEEGVAAITIEWAEHKGITFAKFFTDDSKGDTAAYSRAEEMLRRSKPSHVLAFPGRALTQWIIGNAERRFGAKVKQING